MLHVSPISTGQIHSPGAGPRSEMGAYSKRGKMSKESLLASVVLFVTFLSGCAGPEPEQTMVSVEAEPAAAEMPEQGAANNE